MLTPAQKKTVLAAVEQGLTLAETTRRLDIPYRQILRARHADPWFGRDLADASRGRLRHQLAPLRTESAKNRNRHLPGVAGMLGSTRVAALAGVNRKAIIKWAEEGRINFVLTPGRHYRFTVADVRQLLRRLSRQRNDIAAARQRLDEISVWLAASPPDQEVDQRGVAVALEHLAEARRFLADAVCDPPTEETR